MTVLIMESEVHSFQSFQNPLITNIHFETKEGDITQKWDKVELWFLGTYAIYLYLNFKSVPFIDFNVKATQVAC